MDWDNDYYTFSDTNIEYIWRFLKAVHERGWLYKGHRSTQWCPRCGTSLSQHELGGRRELRRARPPLALRSLPARGAARARRLMIWTTTPWTLPANVAAAVKPDAEYGAARRRLDAGRSRPDGYERVVRGEELVGLGYEGPFDYSARGRGDRPSRHPMGRGLADRGNGHRPHRARLRGRGLRALDASTTCP